LRTLILLALGAPGSAHAGGYLYSASGIVATGRGGAWVAGADTQFAQRFNPAGLVRVEAPTVNVGWSGVQQNIEFRREKPFPETGFYKPAVNQAAPFSVPQFGFSMPIGDQFGFAFGFHSPFAPSSDYDPEGPQRYSVKDTSIIQFSLGPSLAWQPVEQFAIGVGVHYQLLHVEQSLDITYSGTDEPTGDIAIALGITDPVNVNFNVGILVEPIEQISIGASFEPPYAYKAKGQAEVNFKGNAIEDVGLATSKYVDESVLATIELPMIIRGGIAVRPVPKLEIETAVVWQQWSKNGDIPIEQVQFALDVEEPSFLAIIIPEEDRVIDQNFEIPQNFKDTVSYRLGAEYEIMDELDWRIGGFHETGALRPKHMDVSLVDPAKWQIGTGPTVWLMERKIRFDGAAAMLFFPDVDVTNSERIQTDAGVIDGVIPLTVGNGKYTSNGWIVGLQGSYLFRKKG